MSEDSEERYYLCLTCGELKPQDEFEGEGEWWCIDCHEADRHAMNFREAPDGYGYIRDEGSGNDRSPDTDTDQTEGSQ